VGQGVSYHLVMRISLRRVKNSLLPLGLADQAQRDIAALALNPHAHPKVQESRRSYKIKYGPWRLFYAVFESQKRVEVWRFWRKKPHGYARISARYNPQ